MKNFFFILLISIASNALAQSGFKPPVTDKYHLYHKKYNQTDNSPSLVFKGDVVYINNVELDDHLKDPIKLAAINEINSKGNYAFDGKKWRKVGDNLVKQTHYLSHIGQTLPITGGNDTKVNFSLVTDKLFEHVTRFHEATNEFEVLYTGYYEVSANLGFNAFRSDLVEPNFVQINVQLMKNNAIISKTEHILVGKQASDWTIIKLPPTKIRLNSKDKISLVITKENTNKNGIVSSNIGNGEHIGIGNLPQQYSKEIIIEKL